MQGDKSEDEVSPKSVTKITPRPIQGSHFLSRRTRVYSYLGMSCPFVFGQFVSVPFFFSRDSSVTDLSLTPCVSPALTDGLFAVSGAVCTCMAGPTGP